MSLPVYPCPEGHNESAVIERQVGALGTSITLCHVECLDGNAAQCWKGAEFINREDAIRAWNSVMARLAKASQVPMP